MMLKHIPSDAHETGTRDQAERRQFLRYAGNAAIAAGGLALLSGCGGDDDGDGNGSGPTTPAATALTDDDYLNFALNLEYLEASFYSYAVTGNGLALPLTTGTTPPGKVTGGRKVAFTDPSVAAFARELAGDEAAHVGFIRSKLAASAVSLPDLNIDGGPTGAFTTIARSAGLIGASDTFDPYASDENFLLAAFLLEDLGVTAYKGAAALLSGKAYVAASAGLLAAESYHAGLIRTTLYAKGVATPSLRTSAGKISDWRDSLDGSSDLDQGIVGDVDMSNIVPTDGSGIAFSRSTSQVLNIVYGNMAVSSSGGFFPSGVKGAIKANAAAT